MEKPSATLYLGHDSDIDRFGIQCSSIYTLVVLKMCNQPTHELVTLGACNIYLVFGGSWLDVATYNPCSKTDSKIIQKWVA